MRVLVACEESQAVCKAFRNKGAEAFSCDLKDCSGGHPEWHIKGNALDYLDDDWDLIIAHPPCTYLTIAGSIWLSRDCTRLSKGFEAADFFMKFYNCKCDKVCIENPVPMKVFNLPPYSQIIYPYNFGAESKKKTCLWLKGLPLLKPTKQIDPDTIPMYIREYKGKKKTCTQWYSNGNSVTRSKTFPEIAEAMADQWYFEKE